MTPETLTGHHYFNVDVDTDPTGQPIIWLSCAHYACEWNLIADTTPDDRASLMTAMLEHRQST